MRDALIITSIIIFLSIILGLVYKTMTPYLRQFGVLEKEEGQTAMPPNGGVFRSTTFAHSWERIQKIQGDDKKDDFSRSDVFEIQFDPGNASTTYAATSAGLFVNDISVVTWREVQNGILIGTESIRSIAIDPKNSSRMYVASFAGGRGGILKNEGQGFYEVYSTPKDQIIVLGVWIDSYNPRTVYSGTESGLFLESADFGESWRIKNEFEEAIYDLEIVPSDTRIMYGIVGRGKLFKTQNSGISWSDISAFAHRYGEAFQIEQLAIDPHDHNRLYLATSVGLFRSENGGVSFEQMPLLTAIDAPHVSAIAVDPRKPDVLYVGLGSQIHKIEDNGRTWLIKTLETSRKIRVIAIKPDDSNIIYVGVKQ
jgi:hypothetical protein